MGKVSNTPEFLTQEEYDNKLSSDISQLIDKGFSDEDIELYGQDFKTRFAVKKKDNTTSVSEESSSDISTTVENGSLELETPRDRVLKDVPSPIVPLDFKPRPFIPQPNSIRLDDITKPFIENPDFDPLRESQQSQTELSPFGFNDRLIRNPEFKADIQKGTMIVINSKFNPDLEVSEANPEFLQVRISQPEDKFFRASDEDLALLDEFQSLQTLTEEELADIDNQIAEEKEGDFGFFGNIKNKIVSAPIMGSLPNPFFSPQNISKVSKREDLIREKIKEKRADFIDDLGEDKQKVVRGFTRTKNYLQDENRRKIENEIQGIDEGLLKSRDSVSVIDTRFNEITERKKDIQELVNQGEDINSLKSEFDSLSKEQGNLINERNEIIKNAEPELLKRADAVNNLENSLENIGTLEQELDLLRRNYGFWDNTLNRVGLGYANMASNFKFQFDRSNLASKRLQLKNILSQGLQREERFKDLVPAQYFINSYVYDEQEFDKETEELQQRLINGVIVEKEILEKYRDKLRPNISVSQINSLEDVFDFTVDGLADNVATIHQLAIPYAGQTGFVIGQQADAEINIRRKDKANQEELAQINETLKIEGLEADELQQLESRKKILESKGVHSDGEIFVASTGMALSELVFSRLFGEVKRINVGKRILSDVGKQELRSQVSRSVKDRFKNVFKEGKEIIKDGLEEGFLDEFLTNATQNSIERYFLGDTEVGVFDNSLDAIGGGFSVGTVLSASPRTAGQFLSFVSSEKKRNEVFKNVQQISELQRYLDETPDLSDNLKSVTEQKINSLLETNNNLVRKQIDDFDNLSPDDKKKLYNISSEKLALEISLDKLNNKRSLNSSEQTLKEELEGKIGSIDIEQEALISKRITLEANGKETTSNSDDFLKFISDDANVQKIIDGEVNVSINNDQVSSRFLQNRINELTESTPEQTNVSEQANAFANELGTAEDISNIVKGATKVAIGDTDVIIKSEGDNIKIESIATNSDARGQGSARNALKNVTSVADQQGKTLELNVVPLDDKTEAERLVELYESEGFVKEEGFDIDGGKIVRPPRESENFFNPQESEGESIGRLFNNINDSKTIDEVAQEHTDSYLKYLDQQNVPDEVLNSEFVKTFKNRLVDALQRPNDFNFNQERSQQNGSRLNEDGVAINEVDYLREQGSLPTDNDFSGIDNIISEAKQTPAQSPSLIEISTNLNDYTVESVNGELDIKPKFGDKQPSQSEITKIRNQYIEKAGFQNAERVDFSNRGNLSQDQITDIIATESNSPIEVAQEIVNTKNRVSDNNDSVSNSKISAIAQALKGVQVSRDSFAQVDDTNNIADVNPFYFSSRNKTKTGRYGFIDNIRESAQELTNEEISLEDITNFIKENRNPNDIVESSSESTFDLEQRFKELTGLEPTDSNISKVLDTVNNTEQEQDQQDDTDDVPFQTESTQERISGTKLNNLVNRLKRTGLANDVVILSDSGILSSLQEIGVNNVLSQKDLSNNNVIKTPFGFVHNNIVYLNRDKVKKDTPIHEFGHLWNEYIKNNNPDVFQRGLQLIENSEYHNQVKRNEAYSHLDEQGQLEEALAQAIGEKGVKILNESRKAKFNAWFRNLFTKIAKGLGLRNMTANQLSNLTLDKFTDLAGAELLSGQSIRTITRPNTPKTKVDDADVSNIDLVIAEQVAIKETKDKLIEKFRDRDVFGKDIKDELVKYIKTNIDSKRISEIQKSELNKLLNLVKKSRTKKNLLDAFNKVNDIVTALDNKNLKKKIDSILKKKFSKKESGRRKANITNEETEIILTKIRENITDLKSEDIATPFKPNTTNRINERLDNLYGIREALELNDGDLSEIEAISISINILNALNTNDVNNANDLLNESLADIESIFNEGRSLLKEAREKRRISDEAFLNDLEADANPDGKTSNKSVETLKNENQNTGNVVQRTLQRSFHNWFRGRVTASLDSIATLISKKGGDNRDSSSWVQFVNRLKRQETLKKARIRKFANKWKDAQTSIFGSITKADKILNKFVELEVQVLPENSQERVTEKVRYTYSQLLNVWQNNKNEKLRAGLANNGFTQDVIEKIDEILPEKVKDYGNALFDLYTEMYVDSNEVYKSLNFHSLGKPPFYAGKVHREGVTVTEDTNALLGGITSINTTGYASQKERVNNDKPINAVDVNVLFSRSLQESSHYVAFAEVHRLYNKLLKDDKVQKAILLNNGRSGDQILKSLLYYKVRDVEQGGERGNKVVDFLGRNIARSVLGLKAKIGITQTISIINGSFDLPRGMKPKDFIDNYNPSEILNNVRFLLKNSEYMKNRYDVGGLENAVLGLDSITKQSSFSFDNSSVESKRRATARFYKRATDFLLLNVKYGDMVGVLGATPVYSAWKAKFLKDGLSEEQANKKAMAKFEASVDRVQQSISAFGKSEIQKHPYLRYLMMFATAPIQNLQNANFHRRELVKGLRGQESKGSNLRNALAFMNYQFAQPMLYTYISNILAGGLISAIRGLGDDEEESTDADKALLSSAILGNTQSVPLIGGILLYTIDKVVLQKEHTFANIIGSPLYDEIKKTENHIKKAIESDNPNTKKRHIFEAVKKTSGILGGIPNFSFDVFNEWDDVYWNDNISTESKVYRALGYSKIVIEKKTGDNFRSNSRKRNTRLSAEEAQERRNKAREKRQSRN